MTTTAATTCHRSSDGHRVTPRHQRDCTTPGCDGCEPCRESHCRCGRHLAPGDLHCPRCVGRVRDDLARIADLCTLAPIAATEHGLDSAAVVLAGPAPQHGTWTARRSWALTGGLCRCAERNRTCPDRLPLHGPAHDACEHLTCQQVHGLARCPDLVTWLEETSDQRHPLMVLGSWDLAVTEHLGHAHRTLRVTVPRAVDYLRANLTDLARDPDFAFEELARDVRDCREHVESVMAVAIRPTKGAPCPVCHAAGRKARPLVREYDDERPDDSGDRWVCPSSACGEVWTLEQYDRYVEREHRGRALALTASQIHETYRVPEALTRKWVQRGKVHRRGRDPQGRLLYDVADVLACREQPASA